LPIAHVTTRYQITLHVVDQPGVLAAIASLFSEHNVSVETLTQSTGVVASGGAADPAATATLVIGTHEATEAALAATVTALSTNHVVRTVVSVLRVEGI
jgi:homoserine dehydrogenase